MSRGIGRRRHREAPELGGCIRRMARALVRRAGEGELEALLELRRCRRDVDDAIRQAIRASVEAGYSYADIARECGVSAQAIHKAAERAGLVSSTNERQSA